MELGCFPLMRWAWKDLAPERRKTEWFIWFMIFLFGIRLMIYLDFTVCTFMSKASKFVWYMDVLFDGFFTYKHPWVQKVFLSWRDRFVNESYGLMLPNCGYCNHLGWYKNPVNNVIKLTNLNWWTQDFWTINDVLYWHYMEKLPKVCTSF